MTNTSDFESSASPNADQPLPRVVIINVAKGCDIIETIVDVARRSQASLVILSASGTIASATLSNGGSSFRFHGPFNLLSLTGSYFYDPQYTLLPAATHPTSLSFGIQLCTLHSSVICGRTSGTLIAGDDVILTISTFTNPEITKYVPEGPETDDGDNNNANDPYNFNEIGDLLPSQL